MKKHHNKAVTRLRELSIYKSIAANGTRARGPCSHCTHSPAAAQAQAQECLTTRRSWAG